MQGSNRFFWMCGASTVVVTTVCLIGMPTQTSASKQVTTAQTAQSPGGGTAQRHALLVGVTKYPNLGEKYQLQGPGNDVTFFERLLREKFEVPPENIIVLSEDKGGADSKRLPTRTNIEREFQNLAEKVEEGDYAVIYLAGHGSQQPEKQSEDNLELDGLDEIFLPRDIEKWDSHGQTVAQAITDNEIADWLSTLCRKHASVWLIVDACHSGTLLRGPNDRTRGVPPQAADGLGVPHDVFQRAQRRTRGGTIGNTPFQLADHGGICAIYACHPDEVTVEKRLPRRGKDADIHGLLTYTLVQVLTQAMETSSRPLTYRELVKRIGTHYSKQGRNFPTPLLEGDDADREILGNQRWMGRSSILLVKPERINAGALHGMTEGSILQVLPPDGHGDQALGNVQIIEVRTLDSDVKSIAYDGMVEADKFPKNARCRPVFLDLGEQRLRVSVDHRDREGRPVDQQTQDRLWDQLGRLEVDKSLLEIVSNIEDADWILRPHLTDVYLVRATEWSRVGSADTSPLFGPIPTDENLAGVLQERLGRIARAESLKRIAVDARHGLVGRGDTLQLGVSIRREKDASDVDGRVEVDAGNRRVTFYDGDRAVIHVRNLGRDAVDLNLLYINGTFGIRCLFPRNGRYNRLEPGRSMSLPAAFSNSTVGLEHLVLIGIRGDGERADLSALEQASLQDAEATALVRGKKAMMSPLGKLLKNALYPRSNQDDDESVRGIDQNDVDDYTVELLSWHVAPGQRPNK